MIFSILIEIWFFRFATLCGTFTSRAETTAFGNFCHIWHHSRNILKRFLLQLNLWHRTDQSPCVGMQMRYVNLYLSKEMWYIKRDKG